MITCTHTRARARVYIIYDILIFFTENCFLENYYLATVHLSVNTINEKTNILFGRQLKCLLLKYLVLITKE